MGVARVRTSLHSNATPSLRNEADNFARNRCRSPQVNMDMQLLLKNMDAHSHALQLLQLPIGKKETKDDAVTRAVLRACYRLLKAMCVGSPLMQAELVGYVPTFLEHVPCNLVSHDISPTGVINSIFQDNRSVCAQVQEDTVRLFVSLSAEQHAPRFMRFLRMVVGPNGRTIVRNATLVLQLLVEKDEALLLFNSKEGIRKRATLIKNNDDVVNPRGELVYHMELLDLLASCASGREVQHAASLRIILPLNDLTTHISLTELPKNLLMSYLTILDNAWLDTSRVIPGISGSAGVHNVLSRLAKVRDSRGPESCLYISCNDQELCVTSFHPRDCVVASGVVRLRPVSSGSRLTGGGRSVLSLRCGL